MTDGDGGAPVATALVADSGFQTEAAQIRARATLTELLPEPPQYAWTYVPQRVVRNASVAFSEIERLAIEAVADVEPLSAASLQYARLWESLSVLEEAVDRENALLHAAVAYELAGYQANSSSIARQLAMSVDANSPLEQLTVWFLQRYLLRVRQLAEKQAIAPTDIDSTEQLAVAAANAVFARGVDAAARFFLAGEPQTLEEAATFLMSAEEGFARLSFVHDANLVRMVRALIPTAAAHSTWNLLGGARPPSLRWNRYLKILARGVGRNLLDSPSVSELWPSQVQALEQGLLDHSKSSVVRMPTSAGKTRVAELAIVDTLVRSPGCMCVYVAPFRALVTEVEETFAGILTDLGYRVSSIVGAYEANEFERVLANEADLLVVTPEKFDLLLRLRAEGLQRISLVVFDEGHVVDDVRRGAKFELLVARLKLAIPTARLIALSAVVSDQTLEDFSRWLTGSPTNTIESSWRPSLQRVARLQWTGSVGVLRYEQAPDTQLLSEFVPGLIRRRQFEYINPDSGRKNRPWFPETGNKGHVAAALAWEFAQLGPALIFTTQRNWVQALGQALLLRIQLAERTAETIPPYFRTPATRAAQTASEWLGADHMVTQMLRNGIAVHHGQLPNAVRDAIERDFRERKYRVIVATTTLAQGVNLPVRTVIVHSSRRHSDDDDRMERISARDYWNIAGRAGRARAETEGTIVHIVATQADQSDFAYFLEHRLAVEPVESALYRALIALVEERMTPAGLAATLDPEILAMLVEEAGDDGIAHLDAVLSQSLVAVQAEETGQSLDPLRDTLIMGRQAILARIPDRELLSVYSSTGLRSTSCEQLRQSILGNESPLRSLFGALTPDYQSLTQIALAALLQIDEMVPAEAFAGMVGDLLDAWLNGEPVDSIRARFEAEAVSVEQLTRFIEDFFGYQLPWGLAGFLRIAQHVLGIEELSPAISVMPSMVRFGVPSAPAVWAMTAGVPLRRVAIALATTYRADVVDDNQDAFSKWLGGLDYETLREEFGLSGALLDDVHAALARSTPNPLLADLTEISDLVPVEIVVRGTAFYGRAAAASALTPGSSVEVRRDYDNTVDRNAILVLSGFDEIGYVPRHLAQVLAPEVDAGLQLSASVVSVAVQDARPEVTIRIDLAGD